MTAIFNDEDLNLLINEKKVYDFNNEKLKIYKEANKPNHIIEIGDNTEVFITSDIHADYRKFVQILVSGGFISIPKIGDVYDNNNIYNFGIIVNSEWKKNNCLIIIAGDLVDGKRGDGNVNDPRGCFELLLHMLIFNLRIKGKKNNCNILFTIGNHDLETVIAKTDMLDDYIHATSLQFFQNKLRRSEILKEFYELNPYLYLVLSTKTMKDEVAILHGGLHDKAGQQFSKEKLAELQNNININGLQILVDLHNSPEPSLAAYEINGNMEGALWTRFYAIQPIQSCVRPSNYALTVVGHCPTTLFPQLSIILDKKEYEGCDNYNQNKVKGCVILNCLDNPFAPGLPKIALVDASLSSAFIISSGRNKDQEKTRGIELLHLRHNNRNTSRWFNDISRFEIDFKNNKTIDIRSSQTGGGKNYKDKYMIYKMKYLKLKTEGF